jgi:hypothetical protein
MRRLLPAAVNPGRRHLHEAVDLLLGPMPPKDEAQDAPPKAPLLQNMRHHFSVATQGRALLLVCLPPMVISATTRRSLQS